MTLITGGSSILLAPVGSTVIRDQTVTKNVLDHEIKTKKIYKSKGFLHGLIKVEQIHFLRALIFVLEAHQILLYLGMNGE